MVDEPLLVKKPLPKVTDVALPAIESAASIVSIPITDSNSGAVRVNEVA